MLSFCLTWVHMGNKYFVGCRVDEQLFTKVKTHEEPNSTIVRNALNQYFRGVGPNKTLHGYDHELVDVLHNQIEDLRNDKRVLNNQIQVLMVSSIPLLGRIKMRLLK